ncbi:MAG TPA: nucleotidyltransferase domain-containing protein [Longimicrobiales bacterium]|nr:nucleotidyltransferase domain-containing protein [Longimicrobiales bacterium]
MHFDRSVLDDACQRLGVRLLVLFGSHAPGGLTPGEESDVDVAVALRRDVARPSWFELHGQLATAFPGRPVDAVFIADADPLFRWEIMQHGVLLFGDVDEFLELRAFAYRDFVDSADLRALEQRLFEKKMTLIAETLDGPT